MAPGNGKPLRTRLFRLIGVVSLAFVLATFIAGPAAALPAGPTVSSTSPLTAGEVGVAYSNQLTRAGGLNPVIWSVTGGTLPAGLTLSTTGLLSGSPTMTGSVTFTTTVKDAANRTGSAALTIAILDAVTVTSAADLPSGEVGLEYTTTLTQAGGRGPYVWSLGSGTLPPGLTLNGSTGELFGSATAAGHFSVNFTVTDAFGGIAVKALTLCVVEQPSVTTTVVPDAETGVDYSLQLTNSGGLAPFVWSVDSGSLPAGLTLTAAGLGSPL